MDDLYKKDHTQEAKKERGEVFTPEALVTEMLAKLPTEFFTSAEKTMLDNSCGNGNFLFKILELRMKNGVKHIDALRTIYGVELDPANAAECRQRLQLGSRSMEVAEILAHNIICANALDPQHVGWKDVGYMWDSDKAKHNKDVDSFFV